MRLLTTYFLCVMLFFSQVETVFAEQLQTKDDPYEPGFVKEIKNAAKNGDMKSQFLLGKIYLGMVCPSEWRTCLYQNTEGVSQDHFEAVKWFRLAAEQGDAESQCALAFMYEHGFGVRQNYLVALKWIKLAVEQGYIDAQNTLACMYLEGHGVPQDYSTAKKWFGRTCDKGDQFGCAEYAKLNKEGY